MKKIVKKDLSKKVLMIGEYFKKSAPGGMAAVFDGWANNTYTEFNTTINLYCDGNTGEEEVCDTLLFIFFPCLFIDD